MPSLRSGDGRVVRYDRESYSLARAFRHFILAPGDQSPGMVPPGLEGDVATVARGLAGRRMDRGFDVPLDALGPRRRDLTTETGAASIPVMRAPTSEFTDALRAKSVLGQLGARFVSLHGGGVPAAIPEKASGAQAAWIGAGQSVPVTGLSFVEDAGARMSQTVGAACVLSRWVWGAADDELQDYFVAELGAAMGAAIDRGGLVGAGGVEPTGLFKLPGVPTVAIGPDGGPATRAKLVQAMKAVHAANGDSPATARMGWATNPDVEAKLRLTDGGMGDGALWSDADRILGKPAAATTNVPADLAKGEGSNLSALAYGNWADVLVNHSASMQLVVDRFTLMEGRSDVRIFAYLDVRILLRHKPSFCLIKDVATA